MTLAVEPVRAFPAPAHAATIDVVDDLGDFGRLRAEWNELLADSAADCPFLTWEWLHACARHLHGSDRLRIAVVRSADTPIAILPLRLTRRAPFGLPTLEFIGTGPAGSDYLDLVARRGFEPQAVEILARWLTEQRAAVRLSHLPPGPFAAMLAARLHDIGWAVESTVAGECPFISLAGQDWDAYLATLGSSHRANVRRRLRALDRQFDVRFERATPFQRADVMSALIRFHEHRWSGRRKSTAFAGRPLRAFHDDVTGRGFYAGWLRLYGLYLDGDLAAVMYGIAYNRRFYFYQHGFDERYQSLGVGLVLMGLTIRAAIDEGAVEFDLLFGTESYKRLWARESRPLGRLDLFPGGLAGDLHHRAWKAERAMRRVAARIRRGGPRG